VGSAVVDELTVVVHGQSFPGGLWWPAGITAPVLLCA
jgi:hypothetical protein